MNVAQICQHSVVTVTQSEELVAAARIMRERHVGYLVVVDSDSTEGKRKVVGVLTDRDIVVSVVAREVDPSALKVGEVMTRNPLLVDEGCSVDAVLRHMKEAGVRRVPVVGVDGGLSGVLSLDDILEGIAQQLVNVAGAIRSEQRIERYLRE